MKLLGVFFKIIIFLVGAVLALWFFMPWGRIGEYVLLSAEKEASVKGFTVQHSSVTGSWRGPAIDVKELVARMALGGGAFKTLSVSPSIVASAARFSPVISVSFTGGEVFLPGGLVASLGSGSLELSISNGMVLVEKIKSDGELLLDGFMAIDLANAKIDHSDLNIKFPENLKTAFSSMKNFLPLVEEANGTWKLKREKNG